MNDEYTLPPVGASIHQLIQHYEATAQRLAHTNANISLKAAGHLRIATYNVHWWCSSSFPLADNVNGILEAIKTCDADIVVLEESNYMPNPTIDDNAKLQETLSRVRKLAEIGFTYSSFSSYKGIEIEMMPMLVSRYPMSEVRHHFVDDDRILIEALVTLPDHKELVIFGTHLDVYDDSEQTRVTEMKACLAKLKARANKTCIFAGDFNALRRLDYSDAAWAHFHAHDALRGLVPMCAAIEVLEQAGFVDSFAKAGLKPPQATVWSGRRIDYIYFPPSFEYQVSGSYVLQDAASDHFPVLCDIVIPEG